MGGVGGECFAGGVSDREKAASAWDGGRLMIELNGSSDGGPDGLGWGGAKAGREARREAGRLGGRRAFTLIEVMVGTALAAIVFVSLYLGFSGGFGVIQLSRENLRATQIMQDRMETIRLYNWDQITSNGFIPAAFTAPFYATNASATNAEGLIYHGTLTITNAPLSESYSTNLRMVTVKLVWTNGVVARRREMKTFVSRYGIQNYVY